MDQFRGTEYEMNVECKKRQLARQQDATISCDFIQDSSVVQRQTTTICFCAEHFYTTTSDNSGSISVTIYQGSFSLRDLPSTETPVHDQPHTALHEQSDQDSLGKCKCTGTSNGQYIFLMYRVGQKNTPTINR
jgi:hypothetical protein